MLLVLVFVHHFSLMFPEKQQLEDYRHSCNNSPDYPLNLWILSMDEDNVHVDCKDTRVDLQKSVLNFVPDDVDLVVGIEIVLVFHIQKK